LHIAASDVRYTLCEGREGNLVLFVVDASGSMAARKRMAAAKGAILSLLVDAYQRRDRVAMIAFRGEDARVLLPPTTSVELAAQRLAELPTGGRTPLHAGLDAAREVVLAQRIRDPLRRPFAVVVTDGRPTAGRPDPLAACLRAATLLAATAPGIVVDTEHGTGLGMASELARVMRAPLVSLEELEAGALAGVVRLFAGARTGRVA
jgi:magnesium chelatase subunit D